MTTKKEAEDRLTGPEPDDDPHTKTLSSKSLQRTTAAAILEGLGYVREANTRVAQTILVTALDQLDDAAKADLVAFLSRPNQILGRLHRTGQALPPELALLVARARDVFDRFSPEQQAEHRREQAIDWAWGELACKYGTPPITRERIAELYDESHPKESS